MQQDQELNYFCYKCFKKDCNGAIDLYELDDFFAAVKQYLQDHQLLTPAMLQLSASDFLKKVDSNKDQKIRYACNLLFCIHTDKQHF